MPDEVKVPIRRNQTHSLIVGYGLYLDWAGILAGMLYLAPHRSPKWATPGPSASNLTLSPDPPFRYDRHERVLLVAHVVSA